ncbi:MAG: hypothetical protein ABFD79_03150 [Phycisphaerales bacterium]
MLKKRPPLLISFPIAVIFYTAFAVFLFYPYQQNLTNYKILFPVETVIASAGVFILCRRWVLSFFASLAGGAVYGFGTYACSFLCFHPFAGLVYALLPWTFIPAVFFYRWTKLDRLNTKIISGMLVFLSVLFIFAAYHFAAIHYLFPIPIQTQLLPKSLLGIIDPIGVKQDIFAPGFYHVCITGLIMGTAVLIRTRRIGIIVLFTLALSAAFTRPILNVPPVVWASIPVMICSIVIACGLETIVLAGAGDGKWLISTIAILLLLSIVDVFIKHTQPGIIPLSAVLYGLGVVSILAIYFITETNKAWHLLRMFILYTAVFLDIFLSTMHNINSIF